MATSSFKHSSPGIIAGTTRTQLYGPMASGVTGVVFSGVFTNVDSTNKVTHNFTLEVYDGTTYTTKLFLVPVPYGSASKCPKIVLLPGESLWVTAEATNSIAASVEVLERS